MPSESVSTIVNKLSEALSSNRFAEPEREVELHGTTFTFRLVAHGKTASRLIVAMPLSPVSAQPGQTGPFRSSPEGAAIVKLPNIVLRLETKNDRTGKRLGMNAEIGSGDAGFDGAVYIESESLSDDVARIVSTGSVRDATLELLERYGAMHVALNHEGFALSVSWVGGKWPEARDKALETLVAFSRGLPPFLDTKPKPRRKRRFALNIFAGVVAAFALTFAPLAAIDFGLNGDRSIFWLIGGVAGGASLLLLVLVAVRSWGKPRGFRRIVATALLGPIAMGCASIFAILGINCLFVVPDEIHTTSLGTHSAKGSKGTNHYVTVPPTGPEDEAFDVRVPAASAESMEHGQHIIVHLKHGRLGYDWISDVTPAWPPKRR